MDSVIIPLDTKELLLEDAKDFLDSEEWYGQRGIPWQRGWLFYGMLPPLRSLCGQVAYEPVPCTGAPGSGKVRRIMHDSSAGWLTMCCPFVQSDFHNSSISRRARTSHLRRFPFEKRDGRHSSQHPDQQHPHASNYSYGGYRCCIYPVRHP